MFIIKLAILSIYIIVLVKLILKKEPIYLAFWFLPLFMFVWKMVSLIYLEQGVYATEMYRSTYETGADFTFLLMMSIFFLVGISSISKLNKLCHFVEVEKMNIKKNSLYILGITNIHIIILLYLYINLFISGGNFSTSIEYVQNSKLPFVGPIGSTITYFLLVVDGICAFCLRKKTKKALLLFILSVIYMLMIGAKFSGVFEYIVFFFSPLYIYIANNKTIRIKNLVSAKVLIPFVIVLSLFIGYSLYRYNNIYTNINGIDFLFSRLFDMQSGTIWGINDYLINHNITLFGSPHQLSIEINGILSGVDELDGSIGLGKAMYLVAPSYIVDTYLSSGLRFSGWFLVVSFLSMGYFGSAILCIILAIIFAIICLTINLSMKNGNVIMLALSIYEYCQFFDYYRIGNFSILFNPINLLIIIFFICTLLVYTHKNIKRRNVINEKSSISNMV